MATESSRETAPSEREFWTGHMDRASAHAFTEIASTSLADHAVFSPTTPKPGSRGVTWADENENEGTDVKSTPGRAIGTSVFSDADPSEYSSQEGLDFEEPGAERSRVHSALQVAQAVEGWVDSMSTMMHVSPSPTITTDLGNQSLVTPGNTSDPTPETASPMSATRESEKQLSRPGSAHSKSSVHHPTNMSRNHSESALLQRSDNHQTPLKSLATTRLAEHSNEPLDQKIEVQVPPESRHQDTKQDKSHLPPEETNWIAMNLLKAREKKAAEAMAVVNQPEKRFSISSNLDQKAVSVARAISEAIVEAAAQYDPVRRPQSARSGSRAGSARTRPGSSAATATAATGGRISRPRSAARPKRSAKELWQLVRQSYRTSDTSSSALVKVAQPIPYSLTLRHGFQYKYALRHRQQQVLWAGCHVRVPIHYADGRVSTLHDDDENAVRNADDWTAAPVSSYTFITVDRTRTATLWDVGNSGTAGIHKPRAVVKCPMEIEQMAFVSKLCVYVGVGCGRGLKFFNSRLELLQVCRTQEPVLFVKYNSTSGELVTAGSHDICIWTLEGVKVRRKHRIGFKITPTLKWTFTTELPRDEWISEIYVDERTSRVFAVSGTKILVYDHHYGAILPPLRNISTRHVKTLIQHDLCQYTIIGCADGSIQVRNMTHSIIHEFVAHTQGVTALALYPHGHVLVSAALDSTVRMFCLRTFRELYCLHLRDKPLTLEIIDDQLLYIRVSYGIQVWALNHVNSPFANANSKVTTLFRMKSPGIPPRLVTRTEDGVIRLLSPISGKPVTTALPLLETDCVTAVAYCAKIAREDCCHIDIFDGRFSPSDEVPPGYERETGFAILLGTTRNGQVLVFGKRGGVGDRCQLHNAQITQLLCDQKQQLLFTCGADEMIKITSVVSSSTAVALLQPKIAIWTHMIPKSIAVSKGMMFSFDMESKDRQIVFLAGRTDWRMLPSHNRSDDHTDHVTSICPIRKLGLFVSCSKDGTIRVWDANNLLIREIQFQDSLAHICVISSFGDLLFGFQNRLDIIKYKDYLPPTYVLAAQKMDTKTPKVAEAPVPFDDNRTNWQNLQYRAQRKIGISAQEHWKLFQDVNLVGTERPQDVSASMEDQPERDGQEEDAEYEQLMDRMNSMALQRQHFIESAKRRMEAEKADAARKEEIMHEEVRHFMEMRKFRGRSREVFEDDEIPTNFRPTSPDPGILDELGPNAENLSAADQMHHGSMSGPNGMVIAATIMAEYARELEAQRLNSGHGVSADAIAPNAEAVNGGSVNNLEKVEPDLGKSKKAIRVPSEVDLDKLKSTDYAAYERKQRETRIRIREHKRLESSAEMPASIAPSARTRLLRPSFPKRGNNLREKTVNATPAPVRIPAPDGILPNSFVQHHVSEWKKTHANFHIEDLALKAPVRRAKVEDVKENDESTRKKRSEDYKAKLKDMLERMPVQEEVTEDTDAEGAQDAAEEDAAITNGGEGENEEAPAARVRLPVRKMKVEALSPRETPKKVVKKAQLPPTIEKLTMYDWCPVDEIFNPVEVDQKALKVSPAKSSIRDQNRTVKLDKTDPATILPFVLSAFRSAHTTKARKEIVEYIQWMHHEQGLADVNGVLKVLCRYLVTPIVEEEPDRDVDEEISFRCIVIEMMAKFAPSHVDVVPSLLVQSLSRYGEIRSRSTQFLKALGVYAPENKFVTKAVGEIVIETSPELSPELQCPRSLSRPTSSSKLSRPGSSSKADIRGAPVKSKAASDAPPVDVRTAVTNFLKKSLKNYLIRANPNQEIRTQLKGLNIHGFETKGKKGNKNHEDSDDSDNRTARGKGVLKIAKNGSRPSSGLTSSDRPKSGQKKKVVFNPTLVVTSNDPPLDPGAKARMENGPSAANGPNMRLTIPDVEMDMSMLMESITYRPSIPRQEDESSTLVASARVRSFQQLLTQSMQQHNDQHRIVTTRSPISILQNPTTADYVSALNFYMLNLQHQQLKAEQEALATMHAQQELMAARIIEEEKRKVRIEAYARKERDRIEKIEAKKKMLIEAKISKKTPASLAPVEKKAKPISEMQTKGVGLTHRSTCHPSRETLDYDQSKFPPLGHRHGRRSPYTDISMHIGKYNRSMPMERVSLLPFDTHGQLNFGSTNQLSPYQQRGPRIFSASRPPTSVPLGSTLNSAQLAPSWQEFSMEDLTVEVLERELIGVVPGAELRYIRSAGIGCRNTDYGRYMAQQIDHKHEPETEQKFRTQRKYFIPALSVALETVAAGQTYSIID
ncbi:hypothetical protein PhCBS80983_g00990 [Powellomyces hirtus]|uniref:Uncharacterized protein n=1 Tax=Powellomyces hirtus TaxID=109895 RepID=A0A507EEW3_9FUNG|nr:hypothetical protein PhCBS80983_g00990 [Powellomyces hirtus]